MKRTKKKAAKNPDPQKMSAAQYRAALKQLGLTSSSQRTAAALGMAIRNCQRVHAGDTPVPKTVALLLRMYLKHGLMALVALAAITTEVWAQRGRGPTTFYSPGGSVTGRAVTAPSGGTTFYAPNGSVTGRATTSPSGTTTFYSPGGSVTGKATSPATGYEFSK